MTLAIRIFALSTALVGLVAATIPASTEPCIPGFSQSVRMHQFQSTPPDLQREQAEMAFLQML